MKRPLVVGYGNPLCGDDALGWHAVEMCRARLPEVQTLQVQQLTPELAEYVAQAQSVAFIDASSSGECGSLVHRLVQGEGCSPSLSHVCDPSTLLAYARELFGVAPPSMLFSAAGRCFEPGRCLSPELAAVLPSLIERVRAWFQACE